MEASVKLSQKTLFLLFVGLLLLVFFLLTMSDLKVVAEHIVLAKKPVYGLAFLFLVIGVIFYTASWYIITKTVKLNLNFNFALAATWSSIFFNLVTPTASLGGEVARIYFVNRKNGADYGTITATVFLHRIACTVPFLTGSMIGLLYIASFYEVSPILFKGLVAASTFTFASLLFILLLCIKPEIISRLTFKLTRFLIGKWKKLESIVRMLEDVILRFEGSLKVLMGKKRTLMASIGLAFTSWIFDVTVAYFVFLSLNYPLSLPVIIFVYTIGMTIQMLPVGIPGMVGVVESVMATLYTVMGVPPNLSIAATLMIRVVMLWFQVLLGGFFTFLLQKTL